MYIGVLIETPDLKKSGKSILLIFYFLNLVELEKLKSENYIIYTYTYIFIYLFIYFIS